MGAARRRALVLDAGSGTALSAVRSLGAGGWHVAAQADRRAARSRYADTLVEVPDSWDAPDVFAGRVGDALARFPVDVVVPCTDATLLALAERPEVLGGARLMGGDAGWTDKVVGLERAEAAGFPPGPWAAPASAGEAHDALGRLGLPVAVKPRRSYLRDGARLVQRRVRFVDSADALGPVLKSLAGPDGTQPMMQAYVAGRAMSAGAVVVDGRVVVAAARETLSFDPLVGGTSVWKRSVALDEPGVRGALDLLASTGYEGLGEVEFQLDRDGSPRFIEVSARPFGWIGLAMAAGADLPLFAAQALVGDPLPPARPYMEGVQMRWPGGELARLRLLMERSPVLQPGTTRWSALRRAWPPWAPGMLYDGLFRDDLGPWLPRALRRAEAKPRIRPEGIGAGRAK